MRFRVVTTRGEKSINDVKPGDTHVRYAAASRGRAGDLQCGGQSGSTQGREGGGGRDQNEWGLIYLLFFRRDEVSCRVEKELPSLICSTQS